MEVVKHLLGLCGESHPNITISAFFIDQISYIFQWFIFLVKSFKISEKK